jgi:hypothetical protein
VNLASRLEGASGRGRILISESTYRELDQTDPVWQEVCLALPPVSVKGFREPVAVYEVEWRRLSGGNQAFDTGLVTGGQDGTEDPRSAAGLKVEGQLGFSSANRPGSGL